MSLQITNVTRAPADPAATDVLYYVLTRGNLTDVSVVVMLMTYFRVQEVALFLEYEVITKVKRESPAGRVNFPSTLFHRMLYATTFPPHESPHHQDYLTKICPVYHSVHRAGARSTGARPETVDYRRGARRARRTGRLLLVRAVRLLQVYATVAKETQRADAAVSAHGGVFERRWLPHQGRIQT